MTNDEFQALVLQQLQSLAEGQSDMKTRMDRLEKSQDILATEVMAANSKTNSIGTKLTKLAVRAENEIEPKINALFEGYKQHTEQLTRVEERLDSIEIDTGYLVSRVARLERLAK